MPIDMTDSDFINLVQRCRRALAQGYPTEAVRLLSLLGDSDEGRAELGLVVGAIDAFGLSGLRQMTAPSRIEYGTPLFSASSSIEDKLRVVMKNAPPILRLPLAGRTNYERLTFNVMAASGLRLPYCQFPIDRYRVDFAYPEWGLVVEIDDPTHAQRRRADLTRSVALAKLDWRTLRLPESEIGSLTRATFPTYLANRLLESAWSVTEADVIIDSEEFDDYRASAADALLASDPLERNDPLYGMDIDSEIDDDWDSLYGHRDD